MKAVLATTARQIASSQDRLNAMKSADEIRAGNRGQQQLSALELLAGEGISKFQKTHDKFIALYDTTTQQIAYRQSQLNSMKTANQKPGSISFTLAEAIFEAIVFPLRRSSNGVILMPSASQAYPAPISLHEIVIKQSRTLTLPRSLGMRIRQTIRSIIMQAMLFPGIPLAFLLLPISRQVAKVHWRHIVRVLLYSLFLPVTVFFLMVILFGAGTLVIPLKPVCYQLGEGLFTYGIWIALIAWWALATKHYLNMPHGWMIAIVFALLVALLTASILFLTVPSLMINV